MIADSNIVIDLLHGKDEIASKVIAAFETLLLHHDIHINPVIFAETSSALRTIELFEHRLDLLNISIEPLKNIDAFRAGHAFRAYRLNGGPRTTILPDFLIGAQASVRSWPILTRDPKRFESYFPEVEVINPLTL